MPKRLSGFDIGAGYVQEGDEALLKVKVMSVFHDGDVNVALPNGREIMVKWRFVVPEKTEAPVAPSFTKTNKSQLSDEECDKLVAAGFVSLGYLDAAHCPSRPSERAIARCAYEQGRGEMIAELRNYALNLETRDEEVRSELRTYQETAQREYGKVVDALHTQIATLTRKLGETRATSKFRAGLSQTFAKRADVVNARIAVLQSALKKIANGRERQCDDGTTEIVDREDAAEIASTALANATLAKAAVASAVLADTTLAKAFLEPSAPLFAVILEGGLVSCVVSNDLAMVGAGFAVIDYDTEGADADEIAPIRQGDGTTADAVFRIDAITKAEIDYENAIVAPGESDAAGPEV